MSTRGKTGRASIGAIVVCMALLLFAAAADGQTVTVGQTLGGAEFSVPCSEATGCAVAVPSAPVSSEAMVAPISGTVVGWSIGGAAAVPGYNIVVLRKNPIGAPFTVTAASPPVTPSGLGTQSFPSALPIQAGELIAVNYPDNGTIGALTVPSTVAFFTETLTAGAEVTVSSENISSASPAFNATIEKPDPVQPPATQPPTVTPPAIEAHCVVPKLSGKRLKAAKKLVRNAQCKVGLVSTKRGVKSATGKVVQQSPKAGKVLPVHTGVSLKLG